MEVIKDERYTGGTPFINLIEVSGLKGALHGMRNPLNSWRLSDTTDMIIGENDLRLCKNLIKGGTEHRKFLRMIHVQFDLNLPRYVWSEFDTYKVGTVANSCSTMHKLLNKDDEKDWQETELDKLLSTRGKLNRKNFWYTKEDDTFIFETIERLNMIKEQFLQSKDQQEKKHLKRRAKQLLPECYLQMRTIDTNYETLMNIYRQRKNHQLDIEWQLVCKFIEELPYMKLFLRLEEE